MSKATTLSIDSKPRRPSWSLVLAGGAGSRLQTFVQQAFGLQTPKQFCCFSGERTMLEHTLDRGVSIADSTRVVTVISQGQEQYVSDATIPGSVIVQPTPKGTLHGILLGLARILAVEPNATVTLLPADHFIFPKRRFLDVVAGAKALVRQRPDDLVLLAAIPDRPEADYGWIQAEGLPHLSASRVKCFREKPSADLAEVYLREGYWWNTMICTFRAQSFWNLVAKKFPYSAHTFGALAHQTEWQSGTTPAHYFASYYSKLDDIDFSRDLMATSIDHTKVIPMHNLRWCDWGRPERIVNTLAELNAKPAFHESLMTSMVASC